MLKWSVTLAGGATQSPKRTPSNTFQKNNIAISKGKFVKDISILPPACGFESTDLKNRSYDFPMDDSVGKTSFGEREFVLPKHLVVLKPLRRRMPETRRILRVEVHSDELMAPESVETQNTVDKCQSEEEPTIRNVFVQSDEETPPKLTRSSSSSGDSVVTRRTSIATGFTNLVIEAAFESRFRDEDGYLSSHDPNQSELGEDYYNSLGSTHESPDRLGGEIPRSDAPRLLKVSGNTTEDDIYSEACMLFDSESTIYEKFNYSNPKMNRIGQEMNFSEFCDSRLLSTISKSSDIDEESGEDVSITKEIDDKSNFRSFFTHSTPLKTPSVRCEARASFHEIPDASEKIEVFPHTSREFSKSAEDLICESAVRPGVRFESISQSERKKKKLGSAWDKINFTGSFGKRRGRFLSPTSKFALDEAAENRDSENSQCYASSTLPDQRSFSTKRCSSDSQLLDAAQVSTRADPLNDNASEDSSLANGRSEPVNSSFRQRISKFFHDCPKYPLSNLGRRASNPKLEPSLDSTKSPDDTKKKFNSQWPFKVRLVKMEKVPSNGGLNNQEKLSRSTISSITKNIYKVTPRSKVPVETAKFYVDYHKDRRDMTKEPLHDVQFFHTPRVKMKPPDNFPKETVSDNESKEKSLHSVIQSDIFTQKYDEIKYNHNGKDAPPAPATRLRSKSLENGIKNETRTAIPVPRTIFLTQVTSSGQFAEKVRVSISTRHETLSRHVNHTLPKRRSSKTSVDINSNRPSSATGDGIYEPVGRPLTSGEVYLTSSYEWLDSPDSWSERQCSSIRTSSLPSLSGSSSGAVASVSGTSVGITTGFSRLGTSTAQPSPSASHSEPASPNPSHSSRSSSGPSYSSKTSSISSHSNSLKGPNHSSQSTSVTHTQSSQGSGNFFRNPSQPRLTSGPSHPLSQPVCSSTSQASNTKPRSSVINKSKTSSTLLSSSSRLLSSDDNNSNVQSYNERGKVSEISPKEYIYDTKTSSQTHNSSPSNDHDAGTYYSPTKQKTLPSVIYNFSNSPSKESKRPQEMAPSTAFSETLVKSSALEPSALPALGLSGAEDRDSLMWCSDADFDAAVARLSMKGLIELVQSLQDAMVVEQQTFDTLTLQLESTSDSVVQQRLSAALCTSQTRLARLCARNMRCFSQQSLKSRHKDSSSSRSTQAPDRTKCTSNVSKTTISSSPTPFDSGHSSSFASEYPLGRDNSFESRSESPRDSGLAVSSSTGSDGELDFCKSVPGSPSLPPPSTVSGFKNSLAFFQRAAHLVVNNARHAQSGARDKARKRRPGNSDTSSEDLPHSRSLDRLGDGRSLKFGDLPNEGRAHQVASRTRSLGREEVDEVCVVTGKDSGKDESFNGGSEVSSDAGTYEQVLFINGRPQYQDDFRRSYSCEALDSWTNACNSSALSSTTTVNISLSSPSSGHQSRNKKPRRTKHYDNFSSPSRHSNVATLSNISSDGGWTRVVLDGSSSNICSSDLPADVTTAKCRSMGTKSRFDGATTVSYTQAGTWVGDCGGAVRDVEPTAAVNVTLPRRKPYLNLKSVTTGSGSSVVNIYSGSGASVNSTNGESYDVSPCRESLPIVSGVNIKRSQSFKEGLDDSRSSFVPRSFPLTRTQSYNDGLSGEYVEFERPLSRVPSVDEILESVRNLRVKKNMVKSTPDLYQNIGEPVYHTASMPRQKSSSKNKSGRSPGPSGIIGVRYTSNKNVEHVYDRVPEPHYEQISENGDPYYENIHKETTNYENVSNKSKKEVIYDRPRSNKLVENKYDLVQGQLLYENVSQYDLSLYENVIDDEPTYMNVTGSNSGSRSKKDRSSKENHRSRSSNSSKTSDDFNGGQTYDIPRSATHIYDTPKKYSRPVIAPEDDFSEYAIPKNNRCVAPRGEVTEVDRVQLAKQDQKRKIDDIFAEVDRSTYDEADVRRHPEIPPPDYGLDDGGAEYPDEGLGECEGRPFYTEEQGLEVILEEPEEDYCSSPVSQLEEEFPRGSNLRLRLKSGERSSLDGSEGIGSAEGDSSGGGSDHYNEEEEEEDCASSGIHSQDTPSPSTPIDQYKDDTSDRHQLRHEERVQKDRSIDVYPETLRQRQRSMAPSPSKVDIKNWNQNDLPVREPTSPSSGKKFLPSVKALRSQFETGKAGNSGSSNGSISPVSTFSNSSNGSGATHHRASSRNDSVTMLTRKPSGSSLASSSLEKSSSNTSLNSAPSSENLLDGEHNSGPVEPIFCQFQKVDEELRELMSRPTSTSGWDPRLILKRLYFIPEMPRTHSKGHSYTNIEGFLEKLPSGRKKATFWNAWKKRYFVAKDGVLCYYQNSQCDKPSLRLTLMGGKVETMEANMVGVDDGPLTPEDNAARILSADDGKGHYVVMRCSSRSEAERWRKALETHLVEDFASQYVQPHPMTTNPTLLRDTLIIDIGSCSVRAGVLASQATLPQIFFPTVLATDRESRRQIWGAEALSPEVRSSSSLSFPIRPSHRISKYTVDLNAVSSLLSKVFSELKVDARNYNLQISAPRILNQHTQSELIKILFEKFGVKGVNITHQSILALYAYNATSGIVVDIGERMDIVPVTDGYIIEGGVSRVPYGGHRILDHIRQLRSLRYNGELCLSLQS
ncbi:uncharacterized protein LOC108676261 [Hyalella azteca]|uniref:Uncharacterized protein LOC108676261 n=1 Tax=Hyalella azteca TaxID=294128 RepID=A0A8B7P1G1_HYAAZ|nr:uncharacterized protein LOC108676261 [Hyalella azteca]